MYVFPSCFWNAINLTVIGKDRLLVAILNSVRQTGARHYFAPCVLLVIYSLLEWCMEYMYIPITFTKEVVHTI